jgi:hypothetical protein
MLILAKGKRISGQDVRAVMQQVWLKKNYQVLPGPSSMGDGNTAVEGTGTKYLRT